MTQTSPKPSPQKATNNQQQYPPINDSLAPATEHPLKANLISSPQQAGIRRSRRRGLNLRTKATAMAIALSTVPVLVIGATAYFLTNKKITEDVVHEQKAHVISVANNLDRFTLERYKDIQKLSRLSILNNPRVRAVTSAQEKKALLDQYKDTEGYDSIAVADLSGNVLLQSAGGETPTNFSKIDYFQVVMRTNRPFINPARKSVVTGEYSILVAAPVVDTETGKTIGMVRTVTHVTHLNQILRLEENQLEQNTTGSELSNELVLNDKGKVVLATEAKYTNKDAQSIFPRAASVLQAADKVSSVVDINQLDRKNYIVSYAPAGKLEGLPGLNWGVMVVQPTAEAFAARRGLLLIFAIGTAITALLVGAIAAYLANRATLPILAATGAVERLGQGELDTRISIKGEDELAVLGSNINRMAEQLQSLLVEQEEATRQQLAAQEEIARQQTKNAEEQRLAKEQLQARALELLMEVDPLSKGDLTIRASVTEDEIGTVADSYNATINSLRKIVTQVQTTAILVTATTSSSEVSVQELSNTILILVYYR